MPLGVTSLPSHECTRSPPHSLSRRTRHRSPKARSVDPLADLGPPLGAGECGTHRGAQAVQSASGMERDYAAIE
eukprot:4138548-Alexandrium_andersonii.AAC.1